MKRYSDEEILKAIQLRQEGNYSFAELQRELGIPATTIRNWCKDIYIGTKWDTMMYTFQRRRDDIKEKAANLVYELPTINGYEKVHTALLYWCEGAKYPSSNRVEFTNSDPTLVKLFVFLLRKSFPLNEAKLRARLQLHSTHDTKQITAFWSALLDIPLQRFIKPTITQKTAGKHRVDYVGTCTVRYSDFRVQLELIGLYEAFARNTNPQ